MDVNTARLVTIISQLQHELDSTKRKLRMEEEEKEKNSMTFNFGHDKVQTFCYPFYQRYRKQIQSIWLSSIAGSKLSYNNPDIADLSDNNRPQKIGEKFNELYDNEWTDAIDILSGTMEERDAILKIRAVLEYIYKKTKRASEDQYKSLQAALFQRDLRNSETKNFIEIYQKISELQKSVLTLSINNTKQFLREDPDFMLPYEIVVICCESFVDKCVELCWMMQIQDPPMSLDFGSSKTVDQHMFRFFTRSGDVVDFVVWPAILLHENGPLVQKGVVQPVKVKIKGK